jgi:hypothetical protein
MRIEALPGDGTVVRVTGAVGWFAPGFPQALGEALVALLEEEAANGSRSLRLAGRVGELLPVGNGDAAPAFALLAESTGSVGVVINGPVIVRHAEFTRLRGEAGDGLQHCDLILESTIEVGSHGARHEPGASAVVPDGRGSLPGGGVRLEPERATPPLPVEPSADPGASDEELVPEPPIVDGRECARGHFNRPTARYCRICGLAMVQGSRPARGPRPALGVLVLESGTRSLDSDYVLGSDPRGHPAVLEGRARPLALADGSRQIAAAHALIVLDGWTVEVHDLGSPAGTRILGRGSSAWTQLPPWSSAVLQAGAQIGIGDQMIEYRMLHGL